MINHFKNLIEFAHQARVTKILTRPARVIAEPSLIISAPTRAIDGVDIVNTELAQLVSDFGASMRDYLASLLAVGIFTVLARANPAIMWPTMTIAVLCLIGVLFRQLFLGISIGNLFRERNRVRRAIVGITLAVMLIEATITVHLWSNLPRLYGAQEERLVVTKPGSD